MEARVIDPSRCFECGAPATDEHHVIPQVLGGTMTVPLCPAHHAIVHDLATGKPRDISTGALAAIGSARAKREGKHVGRPPYGYSIRRDGRLDECPPEKSVIRVAVAARHEGGWSLDRIAKALNRWGSRNRSGAPWRFDSVAHLLRISTKEYPTVAKPLLPPPPPTPEPTRYLPGQTDMFGMDAFAGPAEPRQGCTGVQSAPAADRPS